MTLALVSVAVAVFLAGILAYVAFARASSGLPEVALRVGDAQVRAEIAASPLARARGLAYRDTLADGRGMLFTFGRAQRHSFWMLGMRFPIDIVWIRDGKVVDVTPDVQPSASDSVLDLATYVPLEPADEVLELPAGYAATHGIAPGARVVVTRE